MKNNLSIFSGIPTVSYNIYGYYNCVIIIVQAGLDVPHKPNLGNVCKKLFIMVVWLLDD